MYNIIAYGIILRFAKNGQDVLQGIIAKCI